MILKNKLLQSIAILQKQFALIAHYIPFFQGPSKQGLVYF